mmetsp:Transcript_123340/g.344027  ORF Transcript_123340/g.344027 Transcript_123340/m.344027 type:complete len:155 (+) Transcript_123340:54-518(+)
MLRAKVLPEVLNQAMTGGVQSVMLMTPEGALLGCTAADAEAIDTDKVVGAITANIWGEYKRVGAHAFGDVDSGLNFFLMDFEDGKVAVMEVCHKYVLCAYADASADLGALKRKLEQTADYLEGPLSKLGDVGDDDAGTSAPTPDATPEGGPYHR